MGKVIKSFRNDFTMAHNAVIDDKRLHLKSLGLFIYLWRQPDDWRFYLREVSTNHQDGIDGTRAAVEELEKYGYLTRIRKRDEETGRYGDSDWILTDEPEENAVKSTIPPTSENPTQVIPTQANPTLLSTNDTKDLLTKSNNNGEPAGNNPFEVYESVTGKQFNALQRARFVGYINVLGNELVIHAIEFAQSKNSPNFGFIDSVLNEWDKNSIRDIASADAYQAVRQRKLDKRIQANHYRTTKSTKKEGHEDGARWD